MSRLCVNCGEKIKDEDIFCPFCGKPSDKKEGELSQQAEVSPGVFICSTCGSANASTNKYCDSCGNPLIKSGAGGDMEYGDSYGSSSYDGAQAAGTSYSYGSYSSTSSTGEKKWYTPPKRTRSAKNPIEWFFWSGWGLYIFFRFLFSIIWIILQIVARSKR